MEHGMNCPHHADKDEACTCALTERTMHAAWRKRAEEAETRIAALEAQVKSLTAERDAQALRATLAYADRDVSRALHVVACKERDAQAEAVKAACRMAYRASYMGFDRAWGEYQINGIQNKIVREQMQAIAAAAVKGGGE